ncbi:MAG: fructosamine kinase family protein [Marinicella sp.]
MKFFTKYNQNIALQSEADGLKQLHETCQKAGVTLKIPEVIKLESGQLTLTLIQSRQGNTEQYKILGSQLAKLHQIEQAHCGYEKDNFIGLNPQKNCISNNWGEFFHIST